MIGDDDFAALFFHLRKSPKPGTGQRLPSGCRAFSRPSPRWVLYLLPARCIPRWWNRAWRAGGCDEYVEPAVSVITDISLDHTSGWARRST